MIIVLILPSLIMTAAYFSISRKLLSLTTTKQKLNRSDLKRFNSCFTYVFVRNGCDEAKELVEITHQKRNSSADGRRFPSTQVGWRWNKGWNIESWISPISSIFHPLDITNLSTRCIRILHVWNVSDIPAWRGILQRKLQRVWGSKTFLAV